MDAIQLNLLHRFWNAANYLTVGQIYLLENPLLREPLRPEHVKPRLLGHWGTSPGLNLIYAHLNRLIREHDIDMIALIGPGHGGPAILGNVYLEGTYSEVYPAVSQDVAGMRHFFRQFSTPGGVPSHVSVPTPGSIHEGGELGYVLSHAFGAAFDNPDLIVAAVVGDGEAETAPLEGAWKSIAFLNPVRDGAVLPILHLNGYKISGPTVLGRMDDEAIARIISGYGYTVHFVEGDDPLLVHQALAATLDECYAQIRHYQVTARQHGFTQRPRWPAIILRTPKGWTGPKIVDGLPVEGTFRAHQVPLAEVKTNPEHLQMLETWMRSYQPDDLFDAQGHLVPELAALAPSGTRRMGANPHANGGKLLVDLDLPAFTDYALAVPKPATELHESTRQLGKMLRDIFTRNATQHNFRLFCPDETNSNRLGDVFTVENRMFAEPILPDDDHNGFSHQGPGLIIVDLMTLYPVFLHPHGVDDATFIEQFTAEKPVIFAFHGYPRAVHEIVHGRPNAHCFHVRGFIEEGTTTTPFDMVVRNHMSRYHLAIEAMRRATRLQAVVEPLIVACDDLLVQQRAFVLEHLEDMPAVRDWVWTDADSAPSN